MSDVSEFLRTLTKNEQPWAICSGRSQKMSDHEQIAQVAHQKWGNEQIARFYEQIAHSLTYLNFSQKKKRFTQKTNERIPSLVPT